MSNVAIRPNGWVDNPEEVYRVMEGFIGEGRDPIFASVAKHLFVKDDNQPVFFWEAEQKVLGKILNSWDQGQVGSCVSHGWGRAAQDLLLWEIASGEQEQWPGSEIAREPIYGGSRVEVGGGRIRGDGSIGAWAAKWVSQWGLLIYKKYEVNGKVYDLSRGYDEAVCRQWGYSGVPNDLEPEARIHPVTAVAMVTTGEDVWAAIGAGKPVSFCSNQGFTTNLVGGFCEPSGSWAHCMEWRGRFVHPVRGKSIVIQNSWGDYLRGDNQIEVVGRNEKVTLPEGCFATTLATINRMCAGRDSFSLAGATGWKKTVLDWMP